MKNPFPYSADNKRYHTWNYHLRQKFGGKVFKVALNGGFTCPNIDGTKGFGGCTYCSDTGSGDFGGNRALSIVTQFDEVRDMLHEKWEQARYIPYFQAHTNTYAPLQTLRSLYEPVLAQPNVLGLSIATRCDALPDDVVDYLAELHERTYLVVELGLQSIHDETGRAINRCHSYADFLVGYERLCARGINVCVHIINGLPGESREMMLQTASALSHLNPHCLKIHLLHYLRGTALAEQYTARNEPPPMLTMQEYVGIVCDQLELLPPEVIIQRVTGDGDKQTLLGPLWSRNKLAVMNGIDKELVRRGSWQGRYYYK